MPPSCCTPNHDTHTGRGNRRIDWLLTISAGAIALGYLAYLIAGEGVMTVPYLGTFAHTSWELINQTWWSLILGVVMVGLLAAVPRELVVGLLGRGGGIGGILRATGAGVLLDLCSHGILMVGMQLYRRGASVGQTMAFLIASPWNSLSLTLLLIALVGWQLTLAFLILSMIIAVIAGVIFELLVRRGILPPNPHTPDLPADFRFVPAARAAWQGVRITPRGVLRLLRDGLGESRMVLRWIFFGFALAAIIRAVVPADAFATYFGPSLLGLGLTVVAATIIEVCSEGTTPVAADLVARAGAPGNAFAFLMAGVATDYTEIAALRETTGSWRIALFLPLITLPQIIVLSWLLNHYLA